MALTRTRVKMPDYIQKALTERKLMKVYRARPDYQQNDYLAWISRAKRDETRQKRLTQMLDELREGQLYMNMKWNPKK